MALCCSKGIQFLLSGLLERCWMYQLQPLAEYFSVCIALSEMLELMTVHRAELVIELFAPFCKRSKKFWRFFIVWTHSGEQHSLNICRSSSRHLRHQISGLLVEDWTALVSGFMKGQQSYSVSYRLSAGLRSAVQFQAVERPASMYSLWPSSPLDGDTFLNALRSFKHTEMGIHSAII